MNWDSRPNSISKNESNICKATRVLNKPGNPMQAKCNMVDRQVTLKRVSS